MIYTLRLFTEAVVNYVMCIITGYGYQEITTIHSSRLARTIYADGATQAAYPQLLIMICAFRLFTEAVVNYVICIITGYGYQESTTVHSLRFARHLFLYDQMRFFNHVWQWEEQRDAAPLEVFDEFRLFNHVWRAEKQTNDASLVSDETEEESTEEESTEEESTEEESAEEESA